MAAPALSIDREFRYIIFWFNEFSELQREDFIPIVVEYLVGSTPNDVYVNMNGLSNAVSNIAINKPMSLFQCRMKLFREWSCKWPLDFKQKLQQKIIEIDPKVGEKLLNEMKANNHSHSNGNAESDEISGNSGVTVNGEIATVTASPVTDDIFNAALAIVNATEEAILSDNRLAALIKNETSVDDDIVVVDDNNAANAHVIEPVGQVQQTEQNTNVIPAQTQTVLNNSAEVPLVI